MNIGLIDVDGHNFPNLALMKIARYHKNQSDVVEWYNPFDHFDKVYMSKVFTHTPDYGYYINAPVEKGGTGYSLTKNLPDEMDLLQPDYSIYPNLTLRPHTDSSREDAPINASGVLSQGKRVM